MKVLTDFHHNGLYYSLHLLFEKRLGMELYRPIGEDWVKEGYWRYSGDPGVVKQYLAEYNPYGGPCDVDSDGVATMDWHEGKQVFPMRAITLDGFRRKLDFGLIVPSVYNHERSFMELRDRFHPHAKMVRQVGNSYDVTDPSITKNILSSAQAAFPEGINGVVYHQEFSLEDYRRTPPSDMRTVKTFVNCTPQTPDYGLWGTTKRNLVDYSFMMHGILGEDGLLSTEQIPRAMGESTFVWHMKPQGDGFGHVVHQAAAMGKPLIVRSRYYDGMLGQAFMDHGCTAIDYDSMTGGPEHLARDIRYWSDPERYSDMSDNIYRRFRQVCDFDREELEIRAFLERADVRS